MNGPKNRIIAINEVMPVNIWVNTPGTIVARIIILSFTPYFFPYEKAK